MITANDRIQNSLSIVRIFVDGILLMYHICKTILNYKKKSTFNNHFLL